MSTHFTQFICPSGNHALKTKISPPVETDSHFFYGTAHHGPFYSMEVMLYDSCITSINFGILIIFFITVSSSDRT
jgi:hypothetical protein